MGIILQNLPIIHPSQLMSHPSQHTMNPTQSTMHQLLPMYMIIHILQETMYHHWRRWHEHPFSLEAVFGIGVPKYYMKKYPHMVHIMHHGHHDHQNHHPHPAV